MHGVATSTTIPSMRRNTAAFVVAVACLGLTGTQAFTGPAITASRSRSASSSTRVASTAAADSTAVGENINIDRCFSCRNMCRPRKIRGLVAAVDDGATWFGRPRRAGCRNTAVGPQRGRCVKARFVNGGQGQLGRTARQHGQRVLPDWCCHLCWLTTVRHVESDRQRLICCCGLPC